jgi:hypothetical protein
MYAAKDAAFVLAAVAAKNAALEYRNDAPWNTKPEARNGRLLQEV